MSYKPDMPIVVQSDRSILLEVDNKNYESARDVLAVFAELLKSPEHIHTYRITPLSLWNAAASAHSTKEIINSLHKYSKYEVPSNVISEIEEYHQRYGKIKILESGNNEFLYLKSESDLLLKELLSQKGINNLIEEKIDDTTIKIPFVNRGIIKQALIKIGFPVEDLAGYVEGQKFDIKIKQKTSLEKKFSLRDYQKDSAEIFYASGTKKGGSGVVVLPCGAGKTIVGMKAMELVSSYTLILTTNITAVKQWKRELLDKTDIKKEDIGEYSGDTKEIKPITIATYQILTYRKKKSDEFPHFFLFNENNWGLIIYDEVHLLPAPVFRITAQIQARRRLGLTATLVREDGKEEEVFSLIGPKKYDAPWKVLEKQGWIAQAECTEVRIELPDNRKLEYATSETRKKIRLASENPLKIDVIKKIFQKHDNDLILIIGQYLEQLDIISRHFNIPLIIGKTKTTEREELYNIFRLGKIKKLIVSKVGNFAVDLPDANVAIQVSGTFGSRQEEAQRLGRILRPKENRSKAYFYSLVTKDTKEQDFAMNRQLFLTEQGYNYIIVNDNVFL